MSLVCQFLRTLSVNFFFLFTAVLIVPASASVSNSILIYKKVQQGQRIGELVSNYSDRLLAIKANSCHKKRFLNRDIGNYTF